MTEATALRIVHAIRSGDFAGVEQFVLRLARQQAVDGHEVSVIGGAHERMSADLAGLGVTHAPAVRTIDVACAVRRLGQGADVVNVHMTAAEVGAVAALPVLRRPRPVIVSTRHFAKPHGWVGPVPVAPLVRRGIDAQIAISRAVAEAIDGPSTVVHSGVEDRPLADTSRRRRAVLMVQRLEPEKHTHIGIRAFAASKLRDAGWVLEIAGTGTERASLEALARSLDVADAVYFLGYRTDIDHVMDRSGILLATCPVEGLGLAVLEAMAGGLPVVAAAAAGHLELLANLDPPTLYVSDDVRDAATKLRLLADDDDARWQLGQSARERQQHAFSLRSQASGTEAVYRSVR